MNTPKIGQPFNPSDFLPTLEPPSNSDEAMQLFSAMEQDIRESINVRRSYVDVCDDLVSGILLSQIVYWFLPDRRGKSKLTVQMEDRFWLAKSREDWWEECRISVKQLDRAVCVLKEKGFVKVKIAKFGGSPTLHLSLVPENLIRAMRTVLGQKGPQGVKTILPKGEERYCPKGKNDIAQRGISNYITETTAETTAESTPKAAPPLRVLTDSWIKEYPKYHAGKKYLFNGAKDGTAAARIIKQGFSPQELMTVAVTAWRNPSKFNAKHAASIAGFASRFNEIREELGLNRAEDYMPPLDHSEDMPEFSCRLEDREGDL